MRMRMPERIDGNARGEIEIAITVGGDEPSAFTSLEGKVGTGIGRQQMRCHG
jgi:hypothetical protein